VRYEINSADDEYDYGCLKDVSTYCTAPCNMTLRQPTPSHNTLKDINGNVINGQMTEVYKKQKRDKNYFSGMRTGYNFYLDENVKVMFETIDSSWNEFWTPLITTPYDAYLCEAGDCCIDGTDLSGCSAIKEWCNPNTLLPQKNCQKCNYQCPVGETCLDNGACVKKAKQTPSL
ncbi:MAG: hypothetical protein V1838_04035, partial [Patescibacteria group bacterium]